jgi:chromosome segregation ATPase
VPSWSLTSVPRRLLGAGRAAIEAAESLPALERAAASRLRSLDRAVHELMAVLPAIAGDLARVRAIVEPQFERVAAIESLIAGLPVLAGELEAVRSILGPQQERVADIEAMVARMETLLGDVQGALERLEARTAKAAELLPDPDAPGPIARAREALTGGT